MISVEYARTMARYNAWQNSWVSEAVQAMDEAEVNKDRGAFFGSILGTLNHLLWGDRMWLHRLADMPPPPPAAETNNSTGLHDTVPAWAADRLRTDDQIRAWADALQLAQLTGDLSWFSGMVNKQVSQPVDVCVMHLFNHQIHHRGQVHAMLTAAGVKTADTDLPFMPDTA